MNVDELEVGLPSNSGSVESSPRTRRSGALWLKVAVSLAVLAAFFFALDWSQAEARFRDADGFKLGLAWVALVLSIAMGSTRWSLIALLHRFRLPYTTSFQLTFAAHFLGQVLPSTIGVDAARSLMAVRIGNPAGPVVASVVVDRMCGLCGMVCLIAFGLPRLSSKTGIDLSGNHTVAIVTAGFAAAVIFTVVLLALFRERARTILTSMQVLARRFLRAAFTVNGVAAIALSVLIQMLVVVSILLIAWSMHLQLSVMDAFATLPMALLIAVLPVSLNGWGIREGAVMATTSVIGLNSADALMVSVAYGVMLFAACVPGAFCWMKLKPASALAAR